MTEERIKELAEAIEKELHSMLRERGYNGIRVQQFIAEHISTVAAKAREGGIDEMRDAVIETLIQASIHPNQAIIDMVHDGAEDLKEKKI